MADRLTVKKPNCAECELSGGQIRWAIRSDEAGGLVVMCGAREHQTCIQLSRSEVIKR